MPCTVCLLVCVIQSLPTVGAPVALPSPYLCVRITPPFDRLHLLGPPGPTGSEDQAPEKAAKPHIIYTCRRHLITASQALSRNFSPAWGVHSSEPPPCTPHFGLRPCHGRSKQRPYNASLAPAPSTWNLEPGTWNLARNSTATPAPAVWRSRPPPDRPTVG
jgi:hypothetical protein